MPTEPGFYWAKRQDSEWMVVHVFRLGPNLEVWEPGWEVPESLKIYSWYTEKLTPPNE